MPILAVTLLQAADMIGGKTAYAPAHYTNLIFAVSIAVGLAAGLITAVSVQEAALSSPLH